MTRLFPWFRRQWRLRPDWREVRQAMSMQMATLLAILPPILQGAGFALPVVAISTAVLLGLTVWGWMVQQEEMGS